MSDISQNIKNEQNFNKVLKTYRQLFANLLSKKDMTFIVGNNKLKITYNDFSNGYDRFVEIYSEFIDRFLKNLDSK